MTVLFLQSPYSFLFRDIGLELKNKNINSYALTFNLGDKYIYKGIKQFDIHKMINKELPIKIDEKKMNKIISIENYYSKKKEKILNEELTEDEKKYFYAYTEILKKIIKKKDINMILMQNDTRWQHALAIYIANKLNIDYLVFELGLFRPNTITIDSKGVNYNNSIPREKGYYENINIKEKFDYTKVDSEISEFKRNLIVSKYMFYYKLGEILGKNSIENKKIRLVDYFNRFFKTYIKKSKRNEKKIAELPKNYIFVPFQVVNDSQTLVHSDFNNMKEFAETVIKGVNNYNNKIKDKKISLVFKEHPMDVGKVKYDEFYDKYSDNQNIIFLKSGNTKKLIKNSKLIITINSTVGIEALEMHKKVICLGKAFYSIDGIAQKSNDENLATDIEDILSKELNENLINNFIDYLKYNYQYQGNEYYYNNKQVKRISKMILKYIK